MDSWPWKRGTTNYKIFIFYIRCHKNYFLTIGFGVGFFFLFSPTHTHIHTLTFKKDEGVYKPYVIFLSHFGKSWQASSITPQSVRTVWPEAICYLIIYVSVKSSTGGVLFRKRWQDNLL